MYIIVIGGGAVGYGLALELVAVPGNEVVMIEEDRGRVADLRDEVGDMVVQGDGAELRVLKRVGMERADLVAAVTGDDGVNLISSQIAKHRFHVPRVVARVNNPRNETLFHRLGIESTVSAAAAVLAQIEMGLPDHTMVPLMKLAGSGLQVVDLHVHEGSPVIGHPLKDLPLPPRTIISLVIGAHGGPQVPTGDTVLLAGDEVVAVIRAETEPELRALMRGPQQPAART